MKKLVTIVLAVIIAVMPSAVFADISNDSWIDNYRDAWENMDNIKTVRWGVTNGIVIGCGDILDLNSACTYGQFLTMVHRCEEGADPVIGSHCYDDAMNWAIMNTYISEDTDPDNVITYGEAWHLIGMMDPEIYINVDDIYGNGITRLDAIEMIRVTLGGK